MQINLEGVVAAHRSTAPVRQIYPGVRIRNLWRGANGAKALILEIDAGASFEEPDVHPAVTFIHHPAGSAHVPQSKDGCVLFVFFPEG